MLIFFSIFLVGVIGVLIYFYWRMVKKNREEDMYDFYKFLDFGLGVDFVKKNGVGVVNSVDLLCFNC